MVWFNLSLVGRLKQNLRVRTDATGEPVNTNSKMVVSQHYFTGSLVWAFHSSEARDMGNLFGRLDRWVANPCCRVCIAGALQLRRLESGSLELKPDQLVVPTSLARFPFR